MLLRSSGRITSHVSNVLCTPLSSLAHHQRRTYPSSSPSASATTPLHNSLRCISTSRTHSVVRAHATTVHSAATAVASHAAPSSAHSPSPATTTTPLPILIIGGGLAGLTLARACYLSNIPFLLFERSPRIIHDSARDPVSNQNASGSGIGLWGPAESCMDSLGIGDSIRHVSYRLGCAGYRSHTGEWLVQPPDTPEKGDVRSCLTLRRGELQKILFESIPSEFIHLNSKYASSHTSSSTGVITLTLHDGRSFHGSLLVAADGIKSAVRAQYHPEVKAEYVGYAYWRAMVKLPKEAMRQDVDGLDNTKLSSPAAASISSPPSSPLWSWPLSTSSHAFESWCHSSTRIAYVPMLNDHAFWFVSQSMSLERAKVIEKELPQKKLEDERDILPDTSSWHAPFPSIVSATPLQDIIFTPIHRVRLASNKWCDAEKRIVFIGDAAHALPPNLAAGGMTSIIDAMELADCVRDAWRGTQQQQQSSSSSSSGTFDTSSLHTALSTYRSRRVYPVSVIQLCSFLIAWIGQVQSPLLIAIRDRSIMMLPESFKVRFFRWMHQFYLGFKYEPPKFGGEKN